MTENITENLQADPIEVIDNSTENTEVNEVKPEIKEEAKEQDWREKIANGDAKVLNKLQRLKTPDDLAKSYLELEKKFSETRPKFQLPENPTPEDVARYRAENGVPEKAEDYDLKLDGGLVINEYDKPIIDAFTKKAHDKNMPAGELKKAIQSFYEARTEADAETNKFIEESKVKADTELKETWGERLTENHNKINTFLENKLGEEAILLREAILPDGTSLSTNPKLLNKFLTLANDFYQTPSSDTANTKALDIEKEISEIKQIMKTDRDGYYNNKTLQNRYTELLETKTKMKL